MFTAEGFAVIRDGKLFINTVSDTKRAAMVNYLLVEERRFISDTFTDEFIRKMFNNCEKINDSLCVVKVTVQAPAP